MNEITSISKIFPQRPMPAERKKVAAYARVSVASADEINSLAAQISFYSSFIRRNPEWEYAGVYADRGISGTRTDNRSAFMQMLDDCENGRINIVLTKSISRFARNTVHLLETVRRLREIGVEVRFERENLSTLSSDGELMLSVLSSFAQEESRSISENVKWSIRRGFERGRMNSFVLYGYRCVGGRLEIMPEEARVVRLIFENLLDGRTIQYTVAQLERMGVSSYRGKKFSRHAVRDILTQEKYTGNATLQRWYIEDHMTHKKKRNKGELPMYAVSGSHDAIISKEMFDKAQIILKIKKELGIFGSGAVETNCFTGRIHCEKCGHNYRRYGSYRKNGERSFSYWCCSLRKKGVDLCDSVRINEETLKKACAYALGDSEFDEMRFSREVKEITAFENGLRFLYYDKTVKNVDWREIDG